MKRFNPRSPRNVTFIKRIEVDGDHVKISRFDDAASMVSTLEFHLLFPFKTREHFVLKQDWRESRIKTGFFSWTRWKSIDEKTHNDLWRSTMEQVAMTVNALRGALNDLRQQTAPYEPR